MPGAEILLVRLVCCWLCGHWSTTRLSSVVHAQALMAYSNKLFSQAGIPDNSLTLASVLTLGIPRLFKLGHCGTSQHVVTADDLPAKDVCSKCICFGLFGGKNHMMKNNSNSHRFAGLYTPVQ